MPDPGIGEEAYGKAGASRSTLYDLHLIEQDVLRC